ncbi:MAG: HNH endonuclease [Pseudomonadota bacterium]|nr:HNH endonuclease [Pseudomonadota bacterium]
MPIGSYDASVKIEVNDFYLTFPPEVSKDQRFEFTYRVEPGQENPARLLAGQSSVHVDVVEHLPAPVPHPQPQPPQPTCVVHLGDRQLVAPGSASRDLFKPLDFEHNILLARIPLGEFGFVDADLKATAHLSGTLSGRFGPGMLTDVCLTHLIGSTPSSAPIEHPLLGRGSRADVTTFAIGGRARFKLPASASASIIGSGKLVVSGDWLGIFELAAIEGGLTARGDASLSGSFDAMVDILAQFTRSSATLRAPLLPIEVVISQSSLDKLDLAAEAALRGHASLAFGLDATAGVRVVGFELWRETWRLRKEAGLGLGWAGGIKYSPNPGIHWVLGAIGKLEGIDDLVSDDADEADVETDDVLDTLLDQARGSATRPDGLGPRTALPFDWHKPIDIYPATISIPNADDPHELSRDAGPTSVRFTQRDRSVFERIGVARGHWPFQGKPFQFVPHEAREEPEKNRLRNLLDTLGFDRSGTDVDHVHELQFGGADTFSNLWPADNSANRSAGSRHKEQLDNYRQQFPNLAGRHFVIARVRI